MRSLSVPLRPTEHALKATFVVIGEGVFSMQSQCGDVFPYPDCIEFTALPHPTETLVVAGGIPVRDSLLYPITQRSIQLAQPIEQSTPAEDRLDVGN